MLLLSAGPLLRLLPPGERRTRCSLVPVPPVCEELAVFGTAPPVLVVAQLPHADVGLASREALRVVPPGAALSGAQQRPDCVFCACTKPHCHTRCVEWGRRGRRAPSSSHVVTRAPERGLTAALCGCGRPGRAVTRTGRGRRGERL